MNQVTFNQVLALPTSEPNAVVPYGPAKQQFGELWLPSGESAQGFPLLILIHGGCWLNTFDVAHSRAMAMNLRQHGYAVWSLEYRRVGDPGGGFPGSFVDIGHGVDQAWLLQDYPLDLRRVVLVGHSAGGHLALWAASRQLLPAAHQFHQEGALQVRGVVGLAAIVDLAEYAQGTSQCERATIDLMGGSPAQQPERYQWVSPVHLPCVPNTVLLHGVQDTVVAPEQSRAAAAKINARWVPIENAGHFDLIHPESVAWQTVLQTIKGVFES